MAQAVPAPSPRDRSCSRPCQARHCAARVSAPCRRQDHGRCPRDLHQEGSSLYREDRECRRRVWREFLSWGGTVAAAPEDGRKKRVAPVKATLKFFLSGEDPSGNCVAERHSAAATCIGFL